MNEPCRNAKSTCIESNMYGFYRDIWEWGASVCSVINEKVSPFDFGRLVVPSVMMNSHYPPWTTSILRTFMLPGRDTAAHSPSRIFISRSKASVRHIVNEGEVTRLLEAYGFILVCLEDWSIAQQIQLFASAKAIVSPHGAGLSNLAFCKKGTLVVEIFHIRHVVPTYWMISNHNKLDYYMMYGQGAETTQHLFAGLEDFVVDLDRLEQTLRLAGLNKQVT